jgi:glycosyltransferase involved in cell wall biosynthesis
VSELTLSAIVTCYKDEPAIPLMHERLSRAFESLGVHFEIIFVNDGSPDDSRAVLQSLAARDPHVLAIEHSRNFGSQNAFVSGMHFATGDAVILLDGDLQDPPELIPAFYAKWREGYDVVYGRRARREGAFLFSVLARAFYKIFRSVSEVPMPLHAGDFSLMDRRVVDELLALPETDQFLRGLRAWIGFKQIGVDYVRPERAFGRSTHSFAKNFWWAKKGIFSFSFLPIEALSHVALVMTLLAFGTFAYQVGLALFDPAATRGLPFIAALVAFMGSLQLLAIALIGQYLIRVFEETKRRPKFIRKAVFYGQKRLDTRAEVESLLRQRMLDVATRHASRDGRLDSHDR